MISKKRYITNGIVMIIAFGSLIFMAHSSGITGTTPKNGNGCTCHSATFSPSVSVVITGPDQLQPNETANYIVSISGGPAVAGGTNIATSAGMLNPADGLRLSGDELTHTSPKLAVGGIITYNFTYTAPPAAGDITLFATGNSVNNNGNNSGDLWNFAASKNVTVNTATGIDDENILNTFRIEQNFPNPFNPSTSIYYEIPDDASGSTVTLKVFDLLGNEVAELVNEVKPSGRYQAVFNAKELTSGVYIYRLSAGNYSAVRKMTLLK